MRLSPVADPPPGWRGPSPPVVLRAALGEPRAPLGRFLLLGARGQGGLRADRDPGRLPARSRARHAADLEAPPAHAAPAGDQRDHDADGRDAVARADLPDHDRGRGPAHPVRRSRDHAARPRAPRIAGAGRGGAHGPRGVPRPPHSHGEHARRLGRRARHAPPRRRYRGSRRPPDEPGVAVAARVPFGDPGAAPLRGHRDRHAERHPSRPGTRSPTATWRCSRKWRGRWPSPSSSRGCTPRSCSAPRNWPRSTVRASSSPRGWTSDRCWTRSAVPSPASWEAPGAASVSSTPIGRPSITGPRTASARRSGAC